MSKTKRQLRSRLVRAGLATAAATATVLAAAAVPANAAGVTLTLSSNVGPTGSTTTTVTGQSTSAWLSGINTPAAAVSIPACPAIYSSTDVTPSGTTTGYIATGATATKMTDYKVAVKLPSMTLSPNTATTTKYNICVYSSNNTTSGALIGQAAYSVSTPVDLTNVTITPASGPALGGTKVTISGTGAAFPTVKGSITATLGGVPLTDVTPTTATSFTATTPYHTASSTPVALVVSTAAGSQTKAGLFTYANGITITPNTAPSSSTAVYMDVYGAGFSTMPWGTTPLPTASPTGARVLLVSGKYNDDAAGGHFNGGFAECTPVTIIADNELICKMDLSAGGLDPADPTTAPSDTTVPDGTYTLTVVSDSAPDATTTAAALTPPGPVPTTSDLSSGATFTVAPY